MTSTGETQDGNSIEVDEGASVTYSVSKTDYVTQTGSISDIDEDKTISVELISENYVLDIDQDGGYLTPTGASDRILYINPTLDTSGYAYTIGGISPIAFSEEKYVTIGNVNYFPLFYDNGDSLDDIYNVNGNKLVCASEDVEPGLNARWTIYELVDGVPESTRYEIVEDNFTP